MTARMSPARIALRGFAAASAIALVALIFRAYQDPSVFVPVLNVFSMCG